MVNSFNNKILLKIVNVLTLLIFVMCSNPHKKNEQNKDVEPHQKNDTIGKIDINELNKKIEKRFSKEYTPKKIIFNDNSTLSFQEHQDIDEIIDNFKPQEPDFKKYTQNIKLDSLGVLLENGQYHPTAIGKLAIKAINNYKISKSQYSLSVFLNQLNWVEKNFYEKENYGFWYFTQPAPLYHLEEGWTSAFTQGTLLNVCLEAYRLTKDKKYAILIEKALKGFLVPIEYGGFMRHWDKNELWFEEYSTKRPSRVLNGTIYGLVGVYNVYKDLGSELAQKIFESGVSTIKNHLEDYDAKYTSRYSLADWKNEVSKENYHEGHVIQLLWLYKITKDPIFKKYAKIFLENDRSTFMVNSEYRLRKPKILEVTANYTIDSINNGVGNLTDEIWAYGNFWSSYKTTELIVDFGEKKEDISSLTLYHVNSKSKDVNFKLYAYDEDTNEWKYVQQFITQQIKDKVTSYNKTGNYETFIEHYKIFEHLETRKVKLIFEASGENVIALREINFIYDRSKDLDYLMGLVNNKF